MAVPTGYSRRAAAIRRSRRALPTAAVPITAAVFPRPRRRAKFPPRPREVRPLKAPAMKLYGYFRSSAAFRVRIALNLKGLDFESAFIHLRRGDQSQPDFLGVNPQGLVP